jgi:molecular chaperone DnaJ
MRGTRGSNLRIKLKLNFEEIARGVTKSIKVKKYVPCTTCQASGAKDKGSIQTCGTCGGSGQVRRVSNTFLGQMQTVTTCPTCNGEGSTITSKCNVCKGEGRVFSEETISIDIPAGVQEGMQLSLGGRGNSGERGGPAGDLIILIEEEAHPELVREGLNVAYELHIFVYGRGVRYSAGSTNNRRQSKNQGTARNAEWKNLPFKRKGFSGSK